MSELSERILEHLATSDVVDSLILSDLLQQDHQKIIGAIKSLQAHENQLIEVETVSQKKWELTEEGKYVVEHGSHEAAVYNAIPQDGILQDEIMQKVPYAKVGFSKAVATNWVTIDKSDGKPMLRKKAPHIVDTVQRDLKNVLNIPEDIKKEYKKRKLLQENIIKSMLIRKGKDFATKVEKMEADLTSDLLINDAWKDKKFKPYNFNALGLPLDVGHLHPLLKVRAEFRKIFLEMGFAEMPTNNFVESSFWNFDVLFQPQQHPARDAHDTFFISEPKLTTTFPEKYLQKVKEVHSTGCYGSKGYGYDWKIEEAQKNLLRTHTTAVSARMLYNLMLGGEFKPVKYFSIDRVFRNETLDATHLAEFHQVEGVIADYGLTLGNLIGVLYEFFSKLGITKLKFKPAYNPYTEPSMEIFCFHNGLEKWIEIGNSGIFRPEMLLPMGLPEDVNVIAWGLSLERPTMIKYGINNIRDLVGPKVDLQMVHNNALCRLEKNASSKILLKKQTNKLESRWNEIFTELAHIKADISVLSQEKQECSTFRKQSLVISCDPNNPLYFLEPLLEVVQRKFTISLSIHIHSSVKNLPPRVINFCSAYSKYVKNADISIVFIWQTSKIGPCMRLSNTCKIIGEVNIARYFNRIIEMKEPTLLRYETFGALYANRIDRLLDEIHCAFLKKEENLKKHFISVKPQSRYIMGNEMSIVDIIYQSVK